MKLLDRSLRDLIQLCLLSLLDITPGYNRFMEDLPAGNELLSLLFLMSARRGVALFRVPN